MRLQFGEDRGADPELQHAAWSRSQLSGSGLEVEFMTCPPPPASASLGQITWPPLKAPGALGPSPPSPAVSELEPSSLNRFSALVEHKNPLGSFCCTTGEVSS